LHDWSSQVSAGDDYFDFQRPDVNQLLFATPKKIMAWNGGIVTLGAIVLTLYWSRQGSAWHGGTALTKLWMTLFILSMLALAGRLFYLAIVGRTILVDGKSKVVLKNGERLVGFGGVSSVDLSVGYYPSIFLAGSSYALSLRLKSGDSLPVIGLIWRRWYEFSDSDQEQLNNEDAANSLDEIAGEIATLVGVKVSKGAR
jgi:hypothetical protein